MMKISGIYKRIYDLYFKMEENKNLCESYKSMKTQMENWEYAELHCVLNVDLEVKEYFKLEYNYIKNYMKNIIIKEIYFLTQEMNQIHYLLFL